MSPLTAALGPIKWMALDAVVDPLPGERLQWTPENGATTARRFVSLDPPRWLVFTYGWKDDLMGIPRESTLS